MYRPEQRADRVAGQRAALHLVAIPTGVAVVFGVVASVEAAVVGFFVTIGLVVWRSRKRPKDVVVLKVAGGELRVFPMGSDRETFRVALTELDDVVLETKEVQRVMDVGANAVNIGMGPIAPSIAGATDTKRIVLEPSRGSPHALTEEFFGHAETIESFAKVRSFLRGKGWTPVAERGEDERDEREEDDEDDDDDD